MRIRTQLIASIAVSALLCVAMGMGVWLALQSQEEFQEAQRRAQTAARESAGLLALTQEFAFYGEERAARQWWKRHANLSEAVSATALPKQINSPSLLELRGSLKQLPELFAGFEKLSKEPLDDLTTRRKQMIVDSLVTNTQAMAEAAYRWAGEVTERRRVVVRRFVKFFLLVAIFFAFMISAISVLIVRRIIRPVAALQSAAATVRQGNLSVRNNSQARDELGDLAREFDAMTTALERRGAELNKANISLQLEIARRAESEQRVRLITDNLPVLIAYVTADERYAFANRHYYILLGLDTQAMLGKPVSEVVGQETYSQVRPYIMRALSGERATFEYRIEINGTVRDLYVTYIPDEDENGEVRGFYVLNEDVTERKQREQAITVALKEKETLLKEVYHRVKNNLQVVTSLLNLQVRTLPEGSGREALKESAGRVRAMSLVHEKLYQSGNLSSIALGDYIEDLCRRLVAATGADKRGVALTTDIEAIEIGLETAVPLGLLLNELVSNSLKHAFPEERMGTVSISLKRAENGAIRLLVADDGVGMPPGMDSSSSPSLGLKLVSTLIAQLDGRLDIDSSQGTRISVLFVPREEIKTLKTVKPASSPYAGSY